MNEPSVIATLLEASFLKAEEMQDFLAKKIPDTARAAREILKKLLRIAFWSLVFSVPLLVIGIYFDNKGLIIGAGLIRTIVTMVFLFLATPVVSLVGLAHADSIKNGIRWWLNLIYSVFIAELLITLIFSLIPLRNNPGMIPVLFLATCLLGFLGFWSAQPRLTALFVFGVFGALVFSFFQPYSFTAFQSKMIRQDEDVAIPKMVSITFDDLEKGRVTLFGPKGENRYWYWYDQSSETIFTFEVLGKNYFHPQNGQKLLPITKEVFGFYRERLREKWERGAREQRAQAERAQQEQRQQAERAQAERELQLQIAQTEREQREQEERERRSFSAPTPSPPPEPSLPTLNTALISRFVTTNSLTNINQSTEVAVLLADQNYRLMDGPSRELAGKLLFANLNASGAFFTSNSVFDILTKAFRGNRQLIDELDLKSRVDFLVLGIISVQRFPANRNSHSFSRAHAILRIISTGENKKGFEEIQISTEGRSPNEAIEKSTGLLLRPLLEKLRSRET